MADLAVNPDEAWLLHEAAARGCKTIDGLGVLVEQMAVDFRLWTSSIPITIDARGGGRVLELVGRPHAFDHSAGYSSPAPIRAWARPTSPR